jgi:LmbE family N-acetylglucosaminyl deacetylase
MLEFSEIERVLVVTAHPDDVDFGAAGTVAALTDAGVEVTYCLVTDGQAGGFDHTIPRSEMASIRREEQTKAAAEVGVTDLRFLGFMDGTVEVTMELRHDISLDHPPGAPAGGHHPVADAQPLLDLRLAPRPHGDRRGDDVRGVSRRPQPVRVPGLPCAELEDWKVQEVWIQAGPMGGGDDLAEVDITAQLDRKFRALRCHVSQLVDPDAMIERVGARFRQLAAEHGLPEGHSVELFRVCDTR